MTARAVKRPVQGLDPMPSIAELRRMYEQRTGKALEDVRTVTRREESQKTKHFIGLGGEVAYRAHYADERATVNVGDVLSAERIGDTLRLTLNFAPRTKKNGTTLGIRQKRAYRLYRDAIIRDGAPIAGKLQLPLPKRAYNICAIYYPDRFGEQADKCGLDQGLYDALENAGVVHTDWYFRQDDGTRIVFGAEQPRVEVHITPLDGGA